MASPLFSVATLVFRKDFINGFAPSQGLWCPWGRSGNMWVGALMSPSGERLFVVFVLMFCFTPSQGFLPCWWDGEGGKVVGAILSPGGGVVLGWGVWGGGVLGYFVGAILSSCCGGGVGGVLHVVGGLLMFVFLYGCGGGVGGFLFVFAPSLCCASCWFGGVVVL